MDVLPDGRARCKTWLEDGGSTGLHLYTKLVSQDLTQSSSTCTCKIKWKKTCSFRMEVLRGEDRVYMQDPDIQSHLVSRVLLLSAPKKL